MRSTDYNELMLEVSMLRERFVEMFSVFIDRAARGNTGIFFLVPLLPPVHVARVLSLHFSPVSEERTRSLAKTERRGPSRTREEHLPASSGFPRPPVITGRMSIRVG